MSIFLANLLKPFYLWILGIAVLWPVKRRVMKMKDGKLKRFLLYKVGDTQPFDPTEKEQQQSQ
jgi:hypothetical protein